MSVRGRVRDGAVETVRRQRPPKAERPGLKQDGEHAVVTGAVVRGHVLDDIPATLRERGINPDDWLIERAIVNTWEVTSFVDGIPVTATNHQLKIFLRARAELALPEAARIDGPSYRPEPRTPSERPRLVAVLSDQQAPYFDPDLHQLVCDWLATNQPDVLVVLGDLIDLPTISRHGRNPLHDRSVQDCIDAGYRLLRDYVAAAGPSCTERYFLPGNHEERLQRAILDRLPELYGLRRGESLPNVLSLPFLLRLDEMGITWVTGETGEYPHAALVLPPAKLSFRHGWIVRQDSGQSALKTLEHLGHSVVIGHTHRQGCTYRTLHTERDEAETHVAVETGTLALRRGGLGYTSAPNWQNGFATVWLHPDGYFSAENAKYVGGALLWESQRFTLPKRSKKR